MSRRTQWAIKVHEAMLSSGESLTAAEILQRFGPSPGRKPMANRMFEATKAGWFRTEKVPGPGNRNRYTATPREERFDWTPALNALLSKLWPEMGAKCAPMFAPATPSSVQARASVMGLRLLPEVRQGKGGHPPRPVESRDGMPRVRSVFELGACA